MLKMRVGFLTAGICAALIGVFCVLAWIGIRDSSATVDEPVHVVASAALWDLSGDNRLNPEHPPLWKYLAGAFAGSYRPKLDTSSAAWKDMAANLALHWQYSIDRLYRTPGFDADAWLLRTRLTMLALFGVSLCALTAWWSWRLGGAVAATVSCAAICLDPTTLAHSPLITNDVPFCLSMLATVCAAWCVGRAATVLNIVALSIACATAPCTKFTGLLVPPMVLLLLGSRALLPRDWCFLGRQVRRRLPRMIVAGGIWLLVAGTCYAMLWGCYRFRYDPTPVPGLRLNTVDIVNRIAEKSPGAENGLTVRSLLWADAHRLAPQAFVSGLLYSKMISLGNSAFFLGEYSRQGWTLYFPAAMLFKTPLASLLAAIVGAMALLPKVRSGGDRWTLTAIGLPVVLYLAFAMSTRLDIGVRHVLPLYPFIFIVIGVGMATLWRQHRKLAVIVISLLGVSLVCETIGNTPYHLSFFNIASGGWRGGINLLGDSNLDWGQDLRRLAEWRRVHPDKTLYLSYFGTADPAYYDIDYVNMFGGYSWGSPMRWPATDAPAFVAVSATCRQGIFMQPKLRDLYREFDQAQVRDVVGSTIYIYDFPLQEKRRGR